MRILLALLLTTAPHANAKWWSSFCERALSVVVMDDPYQYESSPKSWIDQRIEFLEIRASWQRATVQELKELQLLKAELAARTLQQFTE